MHFAAGDAQALVQVLPEGGLIGRQVVTTGGTLAHLRITGAVVSSQPRRSLPVMLVIGEHGHWRWLRGSHRIRNLDKSPSALALVCAPPAIGRLRRAVHGPPHEAKEGRLLLARAITLPYVTSCFLDFGVELVKDGHVDAIVDLGRVDLLG